MVLAAVEMYLWEFPTGTNIELWRKRRVVMQTASAEGAQFPMFKAEEVAGIRATHRRTTGMLVPLEVAVEGEEGAGTISTWQRQTMASKVLVVVQEGITGLK
jgi:hypothetical protein